MDLFIFIIDLSFTFSLYYYDIEFKISNVSIKRMSGLLSDEMFGSYQVINVSTTYLFTKNVQIT